MTEQEKQELSKAVAEKYEISGNSWYPSINSYELKEVYLHDDSERCFDLMVEHDIDIESNNNGASSAYVKGKKRRTFVDELHSDHPTKQEATRIAILRALLAKD